MFFSVLYASIGGVQVLFRHQKQRSPPLGSNLPRALKGSLMACSTLHAHELAHINNKVFGWTNLKTWTRMFHLTPSLIELKLNIMMFGCGFHIKP
jgi:hypothetical protein